MTSLSLVHTEGKFAYTQKINSKTACHWVLSKVTMTLVVHILQNPVLNHLGTSGKNLAAKGYYAKLKVQKLDTE